MFKVTNNNGKIILTIDGIDTYMNIQEAVALKYCLYEEIGKIMSLQKPIRVNVLTPKK